MDATKGLRYSNRESWVTFCALMFVALVGALFLLAITEIMGQVPTLAGLVYGGIVILLFSPLLRHGKSTARWVIFGLFMLGMAVLLFVPWTSRQIFVKDLNSVRPGMTTVQVEAMMGRYMKGTGWPGFDHGGGGLTDLGTGSTNKMKPSNSGEIELDNALVYRHSNEGEYNSDWGIVHFQNGRVVNVEFSPD